MYNYIHILPIIKKKLISLREKSALMKYNTSTIRVLASEKKIVLFTKNLPIANISPFSYFWCLFESTSRINGMQPHMTLFTFRENKDAVCFGVIFAPDKTVSPHCLVLGEWQLCQLTYGLY